MKSRSDFWLTLHKLATDLEREGESDSERAQSICEVLNSLSPATKAVYLSDLATVVASLTTVSDVCNEK